ncbi:TfoX family protein [Pseudooceanicola sediminis]|uniref:TfoX family protein n=1 Tax=Pseudooceanicola sediminis TaxID=2211117 RepID=A0A399J0P5_9RHOB|nr:TfoX/Sxy family protein [Pseudooceanicola sediminis]KAA2316107.1 TfoX/Sxy family protein [Puniceibacterium sp. HSS470]RII38217.1 TfoX family protein [Pseudooceanicola sediminis]|tara:strand:- start:21106 stop:21480 length:375 start_codon:yes stop_codon:yes gene_type:complete
MAVDPDFIDHVRDLFSGLGPLRTGRMFSGIAVYAEEDAMFAMITASQTIYMKTDAACQAAYLAAGATPFTYTRKTGARQVTSLMTLPDAALDDPDEALIWARLSLPAARAAAAEKRRTKARRRK